MQQVDELLDRVSRQLDHGSDEQVSVPVAEPSVEQPWQVPSGIRTDAHRDEPSLEVEPPQAADMVLAVAESVDEWPESPTSVAEAEDSRVASDRRPEVSPVGEPEPLADDEPAMWTEPAGAEPEHVGTLRAGEDSLEGDGVGEAAAEPESVEVAIGGDVALGRSVAVEDAEVVPAPAATEPEPADSPKSEAGIEPEPPAVEAEHPADEPEVEIAQVDPGSTSVADYGAALDDVVSKYSFRKVEHWYELPGFDIPAPADLQPPSQAESDEPGQDSTSGDI